MWLRVSVCLAVGTCDDDDVMNALQTLSISEEVLFSLLTFKSFEGHAFCKLCPFSDGPLVDTAMINVYVSLK